MLRLTESQISTVASENYKDLFGAKMDRDQRNVRKKKLNPKKLFVASDRLQPQVQKSNSKPKKPPRIQYLTPQKMMEDMKKTLKSQREEQKKTRKREREEEKQTRKREREEQKQTRKREREEFKKTMENQREEFKKTMKSQIEEFKKTMKSQMKNQVVELRKQMVKQTSDVYELRKKIERNSEVPQGERRNNSENLEISDSLLSLHIEEKKQERQSFAFFYKYSNTMKMFEMKGHQDIKNPCYVHIITPIKRQNKITYHYTLTGMIENSQFEIEWFGRGDKSRLKTINIDPKCLGQYYRNSGELVLYLGPVQNFKSMGLSYYWNYDENEEKIANKQHSFKIKYSDHRLY